MTYVFTSTLVANKLVSYFLVIAILLTFGYYCVDLWLLLSPLFLNTFNYGDEVPVRMGLRLVKLGISPTSQTGNKINYPGLSQSKWESTKKNLIPLPVKLGLFQSNWEFLRPVKLGIKLITLD